LSKKKLAQKVSPEKNIPAQAVSKNKNSCKLKIPLPQGPSLFWWSFPKPQDIGLTATQFKARSQGAHNLVEYEESK